MKLFNSYSDKLEEFETLKPQEVKMYVCGITPYDTTHLGHAFVYVTFDAFKRFLEFKGYKVTYTQNITDIDDDILKRAKRNGRNWKELGDFWTNKFLTDMKALNVEMPDHFTSERLHSGYSKQGARKQGFLIKATEAIPEIIEMVQKLLGKGFAYEKNGNVYFEVAKFPDYGKLSKHSASEMVKLLKERGGDPSDPSKKAPLDFILWQKSQPGEPFWDSPWDPPAGGGRPVQRRGSPGGRPGWHIECSAMIKKTLGNQIDLHGGGYDLIYPHHESELAQSAAYTGLPAARLPAGQGRQVKYWMHISMVSYQGEKMSKSLGNIVLVSDLLKKYSPNAIRLMLLLNHYRKPWEYNEGQMQKAQEIMDKLEAKFRQTPERWEAKLKGLNDLLLDLEDDFDTKAALKRILKESSGKLSEARASLELLGLSFS